VLHNAKSSRGRGGKPFVKGGGSGDTMRDFPLIFYKF